MMKNEEAIIKAKLEERLRVVELMKKLALILIQSTDSSAADGYAAAIIKGFADLIEKDEGPVPTATSISVPPIDKLH